MYPPIQPHDSFQLHVDTLSTGEKVNVHVECSGNPKGIVILYLHGGPGDCIHSRMHRLYNPKKYHIVLFDQRGCGKSTPRNHTEKNTTLHLIHDIECIRKHIQCERMVVAGGSWGSALALMYAEKHPSRVLGLILRGVYDLSHDNVVDQLYPEDTDQLHKILNIHHKRDEKKKIQRVLKGKTKKRTQLIHLLSKNDSAHVTKKNIKKNSFNDAETLVTISEHYEFHHYFVPKNSIYKHLHKIKHIPVIMVEGRYDFVTPMKMAYRLQKKFTKCKLIIVPAGHALDEKEITDAFVQATDTMLRQI
jgi:proline iminopeptidase